MKEITSLSEFNNLFLPEIRSDYSIRHYFRGTNCEHSLLPKLCRETEKERLFKIYPSSKSILDPQKGLCHLETSILKRFRRYALHHYLAGEHRSFTGGNPSSLEWLCVAQHHNLPTLLLDWTRKPLVALYFACRKGDNGKPGQLWHMRLKPKGAREELTVHLEDETTYRHIENPAGPLVVVPWVFTHRIEAQGGRFIYCKSTPTVPLEKQDITEFTPWEQLDSYQIPTGVKDSIIEELRFCSINYASLFPDLDGWAHYLTNDY